MIMWPPHTKGLHNEMTLHISVMTSWALPQLLVRGNLIFNKGPGISCDHLISTCTAGIVLEAANQIVLYHQRSKEPGEEMLMRTRKIFDSRLVMMGSARRIYNAIV